MDLAIEILEKLDEYSFEDLVIIGREQFPKMVNCFAYLGHTINERFKVEDEAFTLLIMTYILYGLNLNGGINEQEASYLSEIFRHEQSVEQLNSFLGLLEEPEKLVKAANICFAEIVKNNIVTKEMVASIVIFMAIIFMVDKKADTEEINYLDNLIELFELDSKNIII